MNNLDNINIQSSRISINNWEDSYSSMNDIVSTNDWLELYNNINSIYDINSNLIAGDQLNTINNINSILYESDSSLETLDSHSDLDSDSDLLENIDESIFDDRNEEVSYDRNEEVLHQTFEEYNNDNKEIDTKIVTKTLDKLKFKKNESICSCIICLENIDKNKQVYKLKCKHNFHKKCLKSWLKQKLECPVCRKNI